VRALATDRQALAMADALQALDLDLALDVLRHVAAQVALDRGLASTQARILLTSSSVRLRTRSFGLRPVSAQIFWAVGLPMPKM
jgi:hypothetical protein